MIIFNATACGRILAIVATLASSGVSARAATPLYWPGGDFNSDRTLYTAPEPPLRRVVRQPRMPTEEAAQAEKLAKGGAKPTGPLVMAISLESQIMKVYDANGLFAETKISSGVKDHATPMGVFSVIQKNKWHRSNIYSGAPMPYMQRLTWSGIALHAGVVPNHPASHGCVRMPMAFAVKMWSWSRMGARVVIVPGEVSPASFTHPLLTSIKATAAVPMASAPVVAPPVANTKTADASNALPVTIATDVPAAVEAPSPAKVIADKAVPDKVSTEPVVTVEAAPAPKRNGPIAIFVSRKDAKLYVRQNFAPLFDVPVTIAGDQPLGTHVFTAYTDKDTSKPVQWTALTLPANARINDAPVPSRRRQNAGAIVTSPPVAQANPSEALDRLKLPEDVLARLGEQLANGSSLVISDQGITASGETGEGTDFIIRLR